MASTNFLVFDEGKQNMMSDGDYSANTQRARGVTPGIAYPNLHNKLYYQVSVMAKAIADFMVAQGANASDEDVEQLTADISTAFTNFVDNKTKDVYLPLSGGTMKGNINASGYNITATKFIGNLQGNADSAANADIANMANGSNPDNVFKVQSLNKDIDGHLRGCGNIALCNKENKQLGFSLRTKTYPSSTAYDSGAGELYVPNKGHYMLFLNASKDNVQSPDLICQFLQAPLIPKRAQLNNTNINNSKQNSIWDYGMKYYYGYHENNTARPFHFYNLLHLQEGSKDYTASNKKSGGGQLAIEWQGENGQGGLAYRSVTDRNDKDYNWSDWSYPLVRHLENNIKGTDFNDYQVEGIYNYAGKMTNSYQTNDTWGTLVVFNNIYNGASGARGTYLFQSAYCTNGTIYTRYRTNADNWSTWTRVAVFNDQNHLLMPNGAEFWIE